MTLSVAETNLTKLNPILGAVITRHGHIPLSPPRDYFHALASSIISQQISVKAAASIFERFRTTTNLQPRTVVNMSDDDIRSIGLSGQKARYLRDLAQHFVDDAAVFNHLDSLNDDDVIAELTRIKGIGVWTAQMFLIFTLHRPDVFAPDDRGLQLAAEKLYGKSFTRSEFTEFAARWSPYRSAACLHLWHSLNNTPA